MTTTLGFRNMLTFLAGWDSKQLAARREGWSDRYVCVDVGLNTEGTAVGVLFAKSGFHGTLERYWPTREDLLAQDWVVVVGPPILEDV